MADITKLLTSRAPRYTSYPTAPHFHSGVNGAQFASWLRELPPELPLSLYFHIPFCDSLCWFCGCHTAVVNNYRPVAGYVDTLITELLATACLLNGKRKVTHIHWGGGSPTILSPADIARLDQITRSLFDVEPGAEFAIEIDPRGFTGEMAHALVQAGVNRASIGIEDCDPKVQAAINRIQSNAETREAITLLRRQGVDAINLDLIYGLPYQNKDGIARTMEFALSLEPDRLAVFGYAHVPSFKKHQALIPQEALPGTQERLEQEMLIHTLLTAAGYRAIGLDHYARRGDPLATAADGGWLQRNFQGYTVDNAPALLGFGASAISSLPQGYAQNTVSTTEWRALVAAGKPAAAKGIALTQEDRIRRHVIEQLMCGLSVDLAAVRRRFALPAGWFAADLARLAPLIDAGLISVAGEAVTVDGPYRQAARLAAAAFDSFLDRAASAMP